MSTLHKHANININNLFFLEKSEFFLGEVMRQYILSVVFRIRLRSCTTDNK